MNKQKTDYDEADDIAKALAGDIRARMRVEVLIPFQNIMKDAVKKVPRELTHDAFKQSTEVMDACRVTISSMIVAQYVETGMPLILMREMLIPMFTLVLDRECEMIVNSLMQRQEKKS